MPEAKRLVEDGKDIALLSDSFFVVDDNMGEPDRYLVVRRTAPYAACIVARFVDFDFAHFCAKRLSEYAPACEEQDDEDLP